MTISGLTFKDSNNSDGFIYNEARSRSPTAPSRAIRRIAAPVAPATAAASSTSARSRSPTAPSRTIRSWATSATAAASTTSARSRSPTVPSRAIRRASVSGNGGGIYNGGTLTLTNSTVSGNTAWATRGGGIYNSGTLTLTNSTVSGNTAHATAAASTMMARSRSPTAPSRAIRPRRRRRHLHPSCAKWASHSHKLISPLVPFMAILHRGGDIAIEDSALPMEIASPSNKSAR